MTARNRRTLALVAMLALCATKAIGAESHRYSFATLEGEVRTVGQYEDTGELQLLSVELVPASPSAKEVTVLLGPVETCREIGLVVEEGDRVRVRVFVGEDGEPVKAQKILNLSRGVMLRLRTMREVPLWNSAGAWQGGPGRAYRGGDRGARHGGTGGPGRGPGRP
jgi:hypothetical protein